MHRDVTRGRSGATYGARIARTHAFSQGCCRRLVGVTCGSGVEAKGHLGAGVAESGLGGLHVDTGDDEVGGSDRSQVVEAQAAEARSGGGWQPDTFPPVGVVVGVAFLGDEDQRIATVGTTALGEVEQFRHQPVGHGHGAPAGG
nr:hypothetical protein [Acidiferrimicrobium sp. IK]